MNVFKLIILLLSIFFTVAFTSNHAFAKSRCKIKTLRQVCEVCEERALSKLQTDSICPACPESSTKTNCTQVNEFDHLLRSSYIITGMISDSEPDALFKIDIKKNQSLPSVFIYDIVNRNFETAIKDSVGFLFYDIINFNLPVTANDEVLSYNCIGVIDDTSFLNGVCSTIASSGSGQSKSYTWSFTAIPSSAR